MRGSAAGNRDDCLVIAGSDAQKHGTASVPSQGDRLARAIDVSCVMDFKRLPIEDELAIRDLFARYGHLADVGNPDFVHLFTEDATWTRAQFAARLAGRFGPAARDHPGPCEAARHDDRGHAEAL
jgi:hypothetical protein